MASFEVEVTSKDMIKPSSPTPYHLKTLQLALTDQLSPPAQMPFIFFYPNSPLTKERSTLLKTSLADTLVQFYPLAGRLHGNMFIDCNDEGVVYYEARVLAHLSKILENPDYDEFVKLLPFAPVEPNNSAVAGIQVNIFACGGMAISVCVTHKIGDAKTNVSFVNAWASKARGNDTVTPANFISSNVFPTRDLKGIFEPEDLFYKGKIVTKRLMFNKETIESLKRQALADNTVQLKAPPSRSGVVCAFIWKKFIDAAKAKPNPPKAILARQTVNLRNMKSTPFTDDCYGNLFWFSIADCPIIKDQEVTYSELIAKLREAATQVDETHIEKLKNGKCLLELPKESDLADLEICGFSSCITFPIYEVDFGWGKPIWVGVTSLSAQNMVFLYSTRCGQGIEAWVNIPAQDVALLEKDPEFRSLLAGNPTAGIARARL